MEGDLTLRIILETPPAEVVFGLQKGRGSGYETVQKQRSTGEDLEFEFVVSVAGGHPPGFSGPFVQGPRGQRFVYIDIGTAALRRSRELTHPCSYRVSQGVREIWNGGHHPRREACWCCFVACGEGAVSSTPKACGYRLLER
jgi:hypothetical protein